MTGNEYQKKAMRTAHVKDEKGLFIPKEMIFLYNGVMGLNGEAGECIDIVKKHLFQGHELNKDHLAKELGDVLWYAAITAEGIGYTLEEIMQMNVDKLLKRYPNGFEAERSVNRED